MKKAACAQSRRGPAGWVRAGGTYGHVEVEDQEGDLIGDSDHGAGWEVGAGASFAVGSSWRLTPGVRYRSLTRDVTVGFEETEVDLRYVGFEIGLVRLF